MRKDHSKDLETGRNTEVSVTEITRTENALEPWQNFTMGFSFGAILSFVGLSISMDMTHTALADVSLFQWGSAIALPFLLGILSLLFKNPFVKALSTVMSLLPY